MRYFKRGPGDGYEEWGEAVYYTETNDEGWPTQQVEEYLNGRWLRYDAERWHDQFGMLADQRLDSEEWAPFAITAAEFEGAWEHAGDDPAKGQR